MKLIVGLGNPGSRYENNRHNAGFLFVDFLKKQWELQDFLMEKRFNAEISRGRWNNVEIVLIKPQTFMNLSGDAVEKARNYYKIDLKDMLVVYDDVDLPLGEIRFREKGSAGTHNGMRSIVENLGTEDFPRLRIGIESRGKFAPEQMDITDFVLNNFMADEKNLLIKAFNNLLAIANRFLE